MGGPVALGGLPGGNRWDVSGWGLRCADQGPPLLFNVRDQRGESLPDPLFGGAQQLPRQKDEE